MALSNLVQNVILGIILGIIPGVLTKSQAYGRIAVDVGLGIAGCVGMAWFLAALNAKAELDSFAQPALLTGIGSVFAIALGRLVG